MKNLTAKAAEWSKEKASAGVSKAAGAVKGLTKESFGMDVGYNMSALILEADNLPTPEDAEEIEKKKDEDAAQEIVENPGRLEQWKKKADQALTALSDKADVI